MNENCRYLRKCYLDAVSFDGEARVTYIRVDSESLPASPVALLACCFRRLRCLADGDDADSNWARLRPAPEAVARRDERREPVDINLRVLHSLHNRIDVKVAKVLTVHRTVEVVGVENNPIETSSRRLIL